MKSKNNSINNVDNKVTSKQWEYKTNKIESKILSQINLTLIKEFINKKEEFKNYEENKIDCKIKEII